MCRYGSFAFAPPGLTFFRRISPRLRAGLMNAAAARLVCRENIVFRLRGWCVVKIIVLSCAVGVREFWYPRRHTGHLAESRKSLFRLSRNSAYEGRFTCHSLTV